MRFLFGGIAIFLLVAFIVGQIATPRRAPIRKVFAKGFYLTAFGALAIGTLFGVGYLIYFGVTGNGQRETGPLAGLSDEQKLTYVDSLLNNPPELTTTDLEDAFLDFRFTSSALPCYESVHNFDVVSLKEIVKIEKMDANRAGKVYELNVVGEFKTNKPVSGFHLTGKFEVQYTFSEGTRDAPLGWNFSKIYVSDCEVLSKHPQKQVIGQDSLYPGLERRVN